MIAVSGSSLFYHSAEWEFEFYNRSSIDSDDDDSLPLLLSCVYFSLLLFTCNLLFSVCVSGVTSKREGRERVDSFYWDRGMRGTNIGRLLSAPKLSAALGKGMTD